MSSFKKEEAFIIEFIREVTKSDLNVKLYKDMFKDMSDKDFTDLMIRFRDGDILNIIVDSDQSKNKITVENNLKIAKKYGRPMFQHVTTVGDKDMPSTVSLHKNFLQIMPFRRTKQTIEKGISVSTDSKHVDLLTGQPSGVSASAKISNPETQILIGMGLSDTATELNVDRSDSQRSNILISGIKKYGDIPDEVVDKYGEQTRTSQTLKAYLAGMHMKMDL